MHGHPDDHPHHSHPHGHHHGPGHNAAPGRALQWQTPHDPHGHAEAEPESDERRDLDLVEQAFCDGFAAASDPTSFLRLAGVPFAGVRADGTTLRLLRVEHRRATDIGSLTPQLGGGFRYAPLPARLTSRRDVLGFVYFDGNGPVSLTLDEAKALAPAE